MLINFVLFQIFVELTEKDENKSDEEGLVPRPSVSSMETTPTLTTPTDDDPTDDAAFDESPLFGESTLVKLQKNVLACNLSVE